MEDLQRRGLLRQTQAFEITQSAKSAGKGDTMDQHTRDYIDARTEATRAQNDAKFAVLMETIKTQGAELTGKLGALDGQISGLQSSLDSELKHIESRIVGRFEHWVSVATIGLAIIAVIVGLTQVGLGGFSAGVTVSPLQRDIEDQRARGDALSAQITTVEGKLDQVLEQLATSNSQR